MALKVGATSCICLLEDYKNLSPLKKNLSPLLEGCFVHWWQLGARKDNFDHKRVSVESNLHHNSNHIRVLIVFFEFA